MDEHCKDDVVDSICEQLKSTNLKNKEILVNFNLVTEVMDRGNMSLLVKLLIFNTITARPLKPQCGEFGIQ